MLPSWRVVLFWGLLLALVVLLLRACAMYRKEEAPSAPEDAEKTMLLVYDDEAGCVMRMELEAYLLGVVAAEMPASFEEEALKAQAVAARTYTLRRLSRPCGREGAQICTDSTCCQAYRNEEALEKNWKRDYKKNRARIARAVKGTAGEAIYYKDELIEALYHSSSGGRTEDAQHVFAQAQPYLVSVESPGEEVSGKYRDDVTLTRRELAKKINRAWKGAGVKAEKLPSEIKILSRYESGRVEEIRLGKKSVTGKEVRKLLGLNSANFTIAYTEDEAVFSTLGYGHGVGMSQYGANAMALEGADYREILTYYYSGVEIKKGALS